MKKMLTIVPALMLLLVVTMLTAAAASDGAADTALGAAVETSGDYGDYPGIKSILPDADGFTIGWSAYPGAAGYRLFVKEASGWNPVGDTDALSIRHPNLTNDTAYTYTVRALDPEGAYMSGYNAAGWSATFYDAPKMIAVENTAGGQKISWQKVPGVRRYRVYVKSGTVWKMLVDTSFDNYVRANVMNNTDYTYTVRCVSMDGGTFCSGFDPHGLTTRFFEAPRIYSSESLRSGIRIRWNSIPGAAMYRVFVSSGSAWEKLADVKTNTYTDPNVEQAKIYTYTVRALDSAGRYVSGYSPAGYAALYQTGPILDSVEPSSAGAVLRWSAFGDAQRYRLYRRRLQDNGWTPIADVNGLTYTDTGAEKGVPCMYTLRSLDADGNLTSGYIVKPVYYVDGAVADGRIIIDGYRLTFENGKVKTGYVTPQDIIRIAEAEVGTKATDYKRCKYNTWYYGADVSGDYYDWCVVFVEWVFNEAGGLDLLHGKTAGAEIFGQQFFDAGELIKSDYRVGDLLLLHWKEGWSNFVPGVQLLNHVAIIKSINPDGSFTTIEGNTGDTDNGEVMIQTRYPDFVSCACRPKYGFTTPVNDNIP